LRGGPPRLGWQPCALAWTWALTLSSAGDLVAHGQVIQPFVNLVVLVQGVARRVEAAACAISSTFNCRKRS
jgi:hypothetical protein